MIIVSNINVKKGRQADCVERVSTSHPFYYIITKNRAMYNKNC